MPKILIVGGGYAGFYTAWKLEKLLAKGEADVTVVDPRPYMTYQPFLPEVSSGSIDPRHALVPLRRHLRRTEIVTASVTSIDHAAKTATVEPEVGEPFEIAYDVIVVTAGSVSRTFPIPGVADEAVGMKNIEEAVYVRDTILANFDRAAALPKDDPRRARLLTFVVVGGGFAGIEAYGEMRDFASALVARYEQIDFDEVSFHLIEAMGRIMPEVSLRTAQRVVAQYAERGAPIHLETQLTSAVDGHIELSTGETFESDLIVWTAGVMASPMLRDTDLPTEERGRLIVQADLRVTNAAGTVVPDAWGAGDVAAVPDLSGFGVGGFCVPNAQHAVRQGKRLSKNLVAVLRGELPKDYFHKPAGAVAGLGLWKGAFQKGKIGFTGPLAWLAHRGYHGLAMPTWERKARVITMWLVNVFWGRDLASIEAVTSPRDAFQKYASRPKA
ncbi:MAG: NAD(P)/FAD-dependent oxidoreductase [Microbacteriaceae bacterium]